MSLFSLSIFELLIVLSFISSITIFFSSMFSISFIFILLIFSYTLVFSFKYSDFLLLVNIHKEIIIAEDIKEKIIKVVKIFILPNLIFKFNENFDKIFNLSFFSFMWIFFELIF